MTQRILKNQHGMSMLGLIAGVVIVMIIIFFSLRSLNIIGKKAGDGQVDPKTKAIGSECRSAILDIAKNINLYKIEHNEYPFTLRDLISADPGLGSAIDNETLWAEDGNPEYRAFNEDFSIQGYCNDGNVYEYINGQSMNVFPFPEDEE